jgi:hypothetical protein
LGSLTDFVEWTTSYCPSTTFSSNLFLTKYGSTGKHWSAEKVANTFAPHPETKDTVMDWLVESGIDRSRLSLSAGESKVGDVGAP